MERSADGLIKHLVHEKMGTRECCVEAYMHFLKTGERSGKHRHMWEAVIFVAGVHAPQQTAERGVRHQLALVADQRRQQIELSREQIEVVTVDEDSGQS